MHIQTIMKICIPSLNCLPITMITHTHANTHTHTNRFTALWILCGTTRVSRYQKKHSPTHTYCGHQSSLICCLHLLLVQKQLFSLRAWQSFPHSPSFLWYTSWPGTLHFVLHSFTSPNHCLLFAAHVHTIAACSAVVPRLCHVILVSLSTLYLELCLVAEFHTSM